MADDPEEHRTTVERLRDELADVRERLEGLATIQERRANQAQRITDVAALAERARGRLANASAAMRREVVELLDVRVIVSDVIQDVPKRSPFTGCSTRRCSWRAIQRYASHPKRNASAARVLDPAAFGCLRDLPGHRHAAPRCRLTG